MSCTILNAVTIDPFENTEALIVARLPWLSWPPIHDFPTWSMSCLYEDLNCTRPAANIATDDYGPIAWGTCVKVQAYRLVKWDGPRVTSEHPRIMVLSELT